MIDCILCGTSFEREGTVRWRKDGHDIVRCPGCSLLFRAELPAPAELDEIYGDGYFEAGRCGDGRGYLDYVGDEDVHRAAAERRLDLLEGRIAGRELLDVGAAAGFFVDEARRRGWDAAGIDVAESMVEWGRRQLGAPLEKATLADVRFPPGSFDAITMWDYIEHSLDPAADLRCAHELLRAGGVLALSTGDASTVVARLCGSRWHLLTPRHHNYFFTARTLTGLLTRTGFQVELLDHRGSRYPLRYLVHKLRTLGSPAALDRLSRRLADSSIGALAVPLNLWDIATVLARRS